jgi:hypothetical protein
LHSFATIIETNIRIAISITTGRVRRPVLPERRLLSRLAGTKTDIGLFLLVNRWFGALIDTVFFFFFVSEKFGEIGRSRTAAEGDGRQADAQRAQRAHARRRYARVDGKLGILVENGVLHENFIATGDGANDVAMIQSAHVYTFVVLGRLSYRRSSFVRIFFFLLGRCWHFGQRR